MDDQTTRSSQSSPEAPARGPRAPRAARPPLGSGDGARPPLVDLSEQHRQLTQRVYDVLKAAILGGHFRPNDRLLQEHIAAELRVSRTPVREALHWLERDGLVRLVPRKGAVVGAFEDKDAIEIYELRELLEPHAAAVACTVATRQEVATVRRLSREIERASRSDMDHAFDLNREFHRSLCQPCDNRLLMTVLDTVWGQQSAMRIFTYYARSEGAAATMRTEHRAIVESFAARDAERTGELVRSHLAAARGALLELMAASPRSTGTEG
jgi:DNA-binding GntR family transcriptional regulator